MGNAPSPSAGQTLAHTEFGAAVLSKIPAVEDLVLKKARGMLSKWASMVRGRVDVGLAVARKRGEGWRGVTKGDWKRGLARIKVRPQSPSLFIFSLLFGGTKANTQSTRRALLISKQSAGKFGVKNGVHPSAPLPRPVPGSACGLSRVVGGFCNVLQYDRWGASLTSEILDLLVPGQLMMKVA